MAWVIISADQLDQPMPPICCQCNRKVETSVRLRIGRRRWLTLPMCEQHRSQWHGMNLFLVMSASLAVFLFVSAGCLAYFLDLPEESIGSLVVLAMGLLGVGVVGTLVMTFRTVRARWSGADLCLDGVSPAFAAYFPAPQEPTNDAS